MENSKLTPKQEMFWNACSDGNMELIKKLIDTIDDVNFEQGCNSPLWFAVSNNDIECVKLLIEHGANVNFLDNIGNSILDGVCSVAMLELLISKGFNIHYHEEQVESPLYFIGLYTDMDVFKKLIDLGVKYQHLNFNCDDVGRTEEIQNYITQHDAKLEKEQLEQKISQNLVYQIKQKI